ncbi:MAG: (2Fe-2S)-binding protein [Bacteriovoracaceae bacterium]
MYVCICKGITDKQIKEAITSRNTHNPKEILKALGVGSDCGTCVEDAVKTLLEQAARGPIEMKDSSNKT